ncbi:MAG: dihydrodipicolinate synthase family protein [Planctomycetia bacterium]|jgi:dihydrodipicolinate synthase/N-acetylneuraminate lyase
MKAFDAKEIHGNWATLLLPINVDDSIDYGALGEEIDLLIAAEVDGIYSNGTAGEFHNQTEEEFDRVSQMLAEKCERGGMPFQLGVSHTSPRISRQRLLRAKDLSPAAMQVILPDWVPPTMEEAVTFLNDMAELADPIRLVLYNPPHAKRVLSPELIAEVRREVKGLVGVKVFDGPGEDWCERMAENLATLSVFVPGHHLATGVSKGARGAYSNVACLNPAAAQKWYDLMQTDHEAALEIESRLGRFMQTHIAPLKQTISNPAIDKFMATVGAWGPVGTRMRWPYRSADPSLADQIRDDVWRILPEFRPGAWT